MLASIDHLVGRSVGRSVHPSVRPSVSQSVSHYESATRTFHWNMAAIQPTKCTEKLPIILQLWNFCSHLFYSFWKINKLTPNITDNLLKSFLSNAQHSCEFMPCHFCNGVIIMTQISESRVRINIFPISPEASQVSHIHKHELKGS